MELLRNAPGSRTSVLRIPSTYMREVVEKLSFERVYGTPENTRARDIVKAEFDKWLHAGLGARIVGEAENIYGGDPDANILVGAHYDSVPGTPGADDNASAVAMMLAVMRHFGSHRSGIGYVAFNCEEYGLAGSQEFVALYLQNRFLHQFYPVRKIKQVHILEMVGYRDKNPDSQKNPLAGLLDCPTTGDFIGLVSNSQPMIDDIMKAGANVNIPALGFAIPKGMPLASIKQMSPHLLRSDHTPFWEAGIDATMWTDTSEFRNPNYHQSTDTPESLDYDFMSQVAKLLITTVNDALTFRRF